MSNHVIEGKLVASSPSSIDAFDDRTPFGCERRWWFSYVKGMREEETPQQSLGTALHARIENYIDAVRPAPEPGDEVRLFQAVKPVVAQIIEEGIVAVEQWMNLKLAGIQLRGRIDVETVNGILDWKTSSDITRYAKTPGELRKATPMILYAKWLHERRKAEGTALQEYTLEHVYVQTKKKPLVERVQAKITPAMLDAATEEIIVTLERMKVAAEETDVSKLKPDRTKCSRCPFRNQCPQESSNLMSLLNRFKPAEAVVATTAETQVSVLPPDAPKSDPAKAALPVAGFVTITTPEAPVQVIASAEAAAALPVTAAEEVTLAEEVAEELVVAQERRRPRAKKAKETLEALDLDPDKLLSEAQKQLSKNMPTAQKGTIEYKTVTVAHGATVPTVQFGGQRIDLSVTANFTGDVDVATEEVSRKVRELLLKELEKVALTLSGPKLNPGGK